MPVNKLTEPKASGRQAKADAFEREMESVRGAPPIALNLKGHNAGGTYTNEFPARLIPKHPHDSAILDKEDAYALEEQKLAMNGNKNQQIVRTVGKEDIDYVRDKRAILNKLQNDDWMNKVIDKSDPAQGKASRKKQKTTIKPKKKIAKSTKKKTNSASSLRSVHRNGKGHSR